MKKGLLRIVLAAFVSTALLSLVACDQQRKENLEEGVSTEADVRTQFGEPEAVWDGANGERIFEYNRQPAGHRNYHISIGTDGKMVALRQVLNQSNFDRIQPGMMMEDVRKMLGKPAKIMPYDLQKEINYDWRYLENGQRQMVFTVVFNTDMRVKRTAQGVDPDGPEGYNRR